MNLAEGDRQDLLLAATFIEENDNASLSNGTARNLASTLRRLADQPTLPTADHSSDVRNMVPTAGDYLREMEQRPCNQAYTAGDDVIARVEEAIERAEEWKVAKIPIFIDDLRALLSRLKQPSEEEGQ